MEVLEIFNGLLSPEGMADPYPLYAALHEHGPIVRANEQLVLVPGYELASSVLRDSAFRVPDAESLDEVNPTWREHPSLDPDTMLTLNDDPHARIRSLFSKQFTKRRIAELEPAVIAQTDALLDQIADLGAGGAQVDFMDEFAFALPVTVICELIGVPESERDEFRPLARSLTATLEPLIDEAGLLEADAAALKLAGMFASLVAERRARPADDLLSGLVAAAAADEGRISENELIQNLMLLLVAGFETTTNLLGNGVHLVLEDPAAGVELRSAGSLAAGSLAAGSLAAGSAAAAFVEEVLRFDSPVQFAEDRRRKVPAEIGGYTVGPHDHLIVMLGAANHDPRRFAEPQRFWPGRPDPGPLSFGAGAHFCLGAALARLEGTIAFPRLFGRFPALAAAGPPQRRVSLVLRGFEHLMITV
ncbi:MAG TPA: cytochrome P450 [Streptosporangiaceae bacterium]|nr:cytochrome P450 [Streptosporangiaceae bacterium]